MTQPATILVIEDEPNTRALLQVTLRQQGYFYLPASTGMEGIRIALEREPNVVLLDLGLPDVEGIEVTRRIRDRSSIPIIVISARGREGDKITALDEGANDYVTKPFADGELLARVRVALRGGANADAAPLAGTIAIGDLVVDFDLRRATVSGRETRLTPIEFRLLEVLFRSNGRLVTHKEILRRVWGPQYAGQMNYLRVYMKKLRHKIEKTPARPEYLVNEPGVGYRFRAP